MGYCTTTEVENRFKALSMGATTSLTPTKCQQQIDIHSARVDGRLAGLFTVPVTGSTALLILKGLVSDLAAADALDLITEAASADKDHMHKRAQDLRAAAEKELTRIADGEMSLVDATAAGSEGSFRSYNADNSIEPVFKRATRQW